MEKRGHRRKKILENHRSNERLEFTIYKGLLNIEQLKDKWSKNKITTK